jgi:hypothetical protein
MAKDQGAWRDSSLRRLAKTEVTLPLTASELTHAQLRRKFRIVMLALGGFAFAVFAIAFAAAGIFPGFVTSPGFVGDEWVLAAVLFGVPLGAVLLAWLLVQGRVRRRADEADHPWSFTATREGLTVSTTGGRRFEAPWSAWRYAGYRYMTLKNNRIPIGLDIELAGTQLAVEFSRFGRRAAGQLAAALLQGLASAGQRDH